MSTCTMLGADADLLGALDGTADEALRLHIAECDSCRDGRHALGQWATRLAKAGDDHPATPPVAERLAAIVADEAAKGPSVRTERVSVTRLKAEAPLRASNKAIWLAALACVSVGASVIVGLKLADRQRAPSAIASRAWHGKVAQIATIPGAAGLKRDGVTLKEGEEVGAGMHLVTDSKTRVRLGLDDGSTVVLDRATDLVIGSEPRTMTLNDGAILADVAHIEGAPSAKLKTPNGDVDVLGTKLAVTAIADRTNVEVLRGEVELKTGHDAHRISAGQEGVSTKGGGVDVAPVNDLAQRAAFGEQMLGAHNEDAEAPASGLGELRAKRPGRTDEKDRAVRLARHGVKVRIAGNVARTEIDETFANDTDDELEGIYRFPLPPNASIERLALEVDGQLVEGEFIDRSKASAIWRGAIQNAAPKAPKPREEIVWVPGPWHDPALLEWKRGGRFELRIFPIPKRGSRRVVIAYTETVAPVAGLRRYVYPLPQGASSALKIDQFSVDAQVLGHNAKVPVRVRGYELERKTEGEAERLATTQSAFSPSGDLAIEYALEDRSTDATAWGFRAAPAAADPKKPDPIGNEPFVAIALRPKLPKWSEARPRDQVIVIDSGRAMFGERFARAKRLAVQIAQEMDRRDRLTVLACDVTCRRMAAGFVPPGAPGAHDVDAFLESVTPDGATDLVSAVRNAARVQGRDGQRDLRVTVLSDGVVTAGYRSNARLSTEVAEAIDDKRASVVTVPIGADADVHLLADLARGGGGVVVPYQPGQRLEASALEVLNATYGTTLRDVEVVLPPGLHDVAPSVLAPLRAGSEAIVTARMSGDDVRGDLVLRGNVGGEAFEAKYPLEVHASTDPGNGFVPRLFAAARIADRERAPGDAARPELVALSRRFAIPSRATSLLVLESEAMFKAFGIERAEHAVSWTGETVATGSTVATLQPSTEAAGSRASLDAADPWGSAGEAEAKKDKAGASLGGFGGGGPPAKAAPAPAPPPAATRAPMDAFDDAPRSVMRERRPPGGRLMKRVFVRHATLTTDTTPSSFEKLVKARAALAAAPDERSKHKELAGLLALSGQLDELSETVEKWASRDPLDADVIAMRADVAARRGDRDGSLRILSGALAAPSLAPTDAASMAEAIARSHERVGRAEACAFRIAAAETRSDPDVVARAIACERAAGRSRAADRWLDGLKDTERQAVSSALAKAETTKPESAFGDIVVSAQWTGGADLDLVLLDPSGRRAGAVSRLKNVRAIDATSRDRETVALSSNDAGSFIVEVVRANLGEGNAPTSGTVTVRAFGQTHAFPFVLSGARATVGRVEVRWEAELVPLDMETSSSLRSFDRAAAAAALAGISVRQCSGAGQVGTGHAMVTFGPAGNVVDVVVDDANFAGTAAGRCVRAALFGARVAPFVGAPQRVGKSFTIGAL
jgi:hypothetical protein